MSCPVKLAFVIDFLLGSHAGTERQLLELLGGLDRARFDPALFVLQPTSFTTRQGTVPCPVHTIGFTKLRAPASWGRMWEFSRMARASHTRLVHAYFNDAAIVVPPFARLAGCRVIVSRRDLGFWHTPVTLTATKAADAFVHCFVANSRAVAEQVAKCERVSPDRIKVIPNGLPLARFDQPADGALRQRLGIPSDIPVVGMVANLNPWKRQVDLVAAQSILIAKGLRTHLVLVGSGPERSAVLDEAARRGLQDRVTIIEDVDEPVPLVKSFDVCVLCSDSEGLSNAVLEYMFCARPIVGSAVGGNLELIEDGISGLLAPPRSPEALAQAIARILSDAPFGRSCGLAARRAAERSYTTDRMVEAHMQLYDSLAT